jgi:hypothetical protein
MTYYTLLIEKNKARNSREKNETGLSFSLANFSIVAFVVGIKDGASSMRIKKGS